jgi:hypothetical protein
MINIIITVIVGIACIITGIIAGKKMESKKKYAMVELIEFKRKK